MDCDGAIATVISEQVPAAYRNLSMTIQGAMMWKSVFADPRGKIPLESDAIRITGSIAREKDPSTGVRPVGVRI
jgi:hypothetical protein